MSRAPLYLPPAQLEALGGPVARRLAWWRANAAQRLADAGVPPAALGHRFRRHSDAARVAAVETVHAAGIVTAALPTTVAQRADLPDDAGWWGFSMRDVPARSVAATLILRLDNARVLSDQTDDSARDYSPAILDRRGRSLDLREIRYRPFHAPLARRPPDMVRDRAVWIAERVFDNHSHWLSAHLPKLILLRDRDLLRGDLVLPAHRPARIDDSLHAIGIDPDACHLLAVGQVLHARRLVLVACDRFHPALLDRARSVLAPATTSPARRILISRRAARGRTLIGEDALLPLLAAHGIAPVVMEELEFAAQVALMAQAEVVVAPHGAGLTNMLFCRPGAHIVEIADPTYPNPNFYAMAAALGLTYTLVAGEGVGDGHPLHRNLAVTADALGASLAALP